MLIFSDFSYGFITPEMISVVSDLCQQHGILVVADSQSSSQNGRIGKFTNTYLITPTEFEARQALDYYSDGLVTIASQMIERFCNKMCIRERKFRKSIFSLKSICWQSILNKSFEKRYYSSI